MVKKWKDAGTEGPYFDFSEFWLYKCTSLFLIKQQKAAATIKAN